MNIKAIALSTMMALGVMSTSAMAASCGPGTCTVDNGDGQDLSNVVTFNISDIANGDDDNFIFTAVFTNDIGAWGALAFTTLNSFIIPPLPGGFTPAYIADLTLNILGQEHTITDENGESTGAFSNASEILVDLSSTSMGDPVEFTLTGQAFNSSAGNRPDINIEISAVPVPAAGLLLLGGLGGLAALRRRKQKS